MLWRDPDAGYYVEWCLMNLPDEDPEQDLEEEEASCREYDWKIKELRGAKIAAWDAAVRGEEGK